VGPVLGLRGPVARGRELEKGCRDQDAQEDAAGAGEEGGVVAGVEGGDGVGVGPGEDRGVGGGHGGEHGEALKRRPSAGRC
jgi:hypothetical protein